VDYQTASGTLTFTAGQTTQTVSVTILGDRTRESNETFQVRLSSAVGAVIADDTGVVTILTDEGALTVSAATVSGGQTALTVDEATPVLDAAIQLWEQAGVDTTALQGLTLLVTDLPDTLVALTEESTIYLDIDAAGYGWFVDATPLDSREYRRKGDALAAHPNSDAFGKMDLLTVLMHETGHVLGYEHTEDGLMDEVLAPGERNLESTDASLTFTDLPFGESYGRKRRFAWDEEFSAL
jgi:hypothetical protein